MSLNPYVWLGALLAMLALVGSAALYKHHYDESKRDEGREEIRFEWHKAVVKAQEKEAKATAEADDFQRRANAKRESDFKLQLAQRTAELLARLSAQPISPDVTGQLRESVRTANGQSAAEPAKDSTPAPRPTNGRSLTEWFSQVAEMYRECHDTVMGWIKWDDERVTP